MFRHRLLGAPSLAKNSLGHPCSPINRLLAGSSILESEQRHSIPIPLVPEFFGSSLAVREPIAAIASRWLREMLASSALDQTLGRPISPARHRSFLEVDTQLEQLAVNA